MYRSSAAITGRLQPAWRNPAVLPFSFPLVAAHITGESRLNSVRRCQLRIRQIGLELFLLSGVPRLQALGLVKGSEKISRLVVKPSVDMRWPRRGLVAIPPITTRQARQLESSPARFNDGQASCAIDRAALVRTAQEGSQRHLHHLAHASRDGGQ